MAKSPLVYLVDDDPSVRRAVGRLIRSEGFAVKGFASAQEFLKETDLGLSEHGCLVLDIHMPDMNGLELLDELVARRERVPVILITGQAYSEDAREKALKAGAVDFLEKPFEDQALLDAIHKALDQSAERRL